MRTIALCAALSTLAACATPSSPADPKPLAIDPRLCAEVKQEPPVQGGIVQPATAAEREATSAFLTGEASAREWGREGWARATLARTLCPKP